MFNLKEKLADLIISALWLAGDKIFDWVINPQVSARMRDKAEKKWRERTIAAAALPKGMWNDNRRQALESQGVYYRFQLSEGGEDK